MTVQRPYRRTCRQFADGSYYDSGGWKYILHPCFAKDAGRYVRAFLILQKDFQELLEYVDPSDTNLPCFSFRMHELLMRICIEIEANLKAISFENNYKRKGNWSMKDYKKIELSHKLSEYYVRIPYWHGEKGVWKPFSAWGERASPSWYDAYNSAKHDRLKEFHKASFENVVQAICGLVALMSSQFLSEDFRPGLGFLGMDGPDDDFEEAVGAYFNVRFPANWPKSDRYDFSWPDLAQLSDPFLEHDYR